MLSKQIKAYYKNKAFDNSYYMDLIEKAITQHGSLDRKDIDELLWNKLPDWMEDSQKKVKINNIISQMRKKGRMQNEGNFPKPKWTLKKSL